MSPWRTLAVPGTALLALTAALSAHTVAIDLATPRDAHGTPHATSARCRHCRESRYASRARTFNRTMTQDAAVLGAVLGTFDGRSIRDLSADATMERARSGEPRITFTDALTQAAVIASRCPIPHRTPAMRAPTHAPSATSTRPAAGPSTPMRRCSAAQLPAPTPLEATRCQTTRSTSRRSHARSPAAIRAPTEQCVCALRQRRSAHRKAARRSART